MGLTREQLAERRHKDALKIREYNTIMKPKWEKQAQEERERIAALEMLLDANWSQSNGYFIKVVKEPHDGKPWPAFVTHFYDRTGNYIGDDQVTS